MKKALLCVSFGTTVENGRADIEAVETALRAAAPDRVFARAFTSVVVRRVLAEHGETVDGVPAALEKLSAQGYTDVVLQPTHLLCGREYDKLKAQAAPFAARFENLIVGQPLLYGIDDLRLLAGVLADAYPPAVGETLLLMGHGTEHFAGVAYAALQTAFRMLGRSDVLVATVEGWPTLQDAQKAIRKAKSKSVCLVPLLLVAGDHACNDMAGSEPTSWKSALAAQGLTVRCVLHGLGSMPEIQELYRRKLQGVLEQ